MSEAPSTDVCEIFIRDEFARIEKIPVKNNTHYHKRNILFYGWLLQKDNLSIEWATLSKLVGIPIPQIEQIITDNLTDYIENITPQAFRFFENMMIGIQRVLDDPSEHYFITQPLPYFGDLLGENWLMSHQGERCRQRPCAEQEKD